MTHRKNTCRVMLATLPAYSGENRAHANAFKEFSLSACCSRVVPWVPFGTLTSLRMVMSIYVHLAWVFSKLFYSMHAFVSCYCKFLCWEVLTAGTASKVECALLGRLPVLECGWYHSGCSWTSLLSAGLAWTYSRKPTSLWSTLGRVHAVRSPTRQINVSSSSHLSPGQTVVQPRLTPR